MATVSSLLPRTVASLRRHPPPPNSKSKHPSPSISASSESDGFFWNYCTVGSRLPALGEQIHLHSTWIANEATCT